MQAIRATHAGKPFVLAFWSVTCEPCRHEMAHWNALRKKYPNIAIVLVATDPPAERATMERFLARYNPGSVERWGFADEFVERVRYAVDPTWRGELPKTYFYDAKHRVTPRTGELDVQWVERWYAEQAKQAR
jgi:thiol-disulfide isomerase/thioredoxin